MIDKSGNYRFSRLGEIGNLRTASFREYGNYPGQMHDMVTRLIREFDDLTKRLISVETKPFAFISPKNLS